MEEFKQKYLHECIVLIPIYKQFKGLSEYEVRSLEQVLKILKNYPIAFFGSKNIEWNLYIQFCEDRGIKPSIELFSEYYFENIAGYNQLLQDQLFYERFCKYNFILIYQLDAFVFRDELDYWCRKGFDYIGAPWFEGWHLPVKQSKIIGVGNGGFSLRKVSSFIRINKKISIMNFLGKKYERFYLHKLIPLKYFLEAFCILMNLKYSQEVLDIYYKKYVNEDYFWCMKIPAVFSFFKIASFADAMGFSFDANPDVLYEMNNKQLPFGCHALERYGNEFWKPFIQERL